MPDDDDLPSYAELLTLLTEISEHAEKLPPALAIELQKLLGRFPGDEMDDQPSAPAGRDVGQR